MTFKKTNTNIAPCDIELVEWLQIGDRRICREVKWLFEKAFERGNYSIAEKADQRRRSITKHHDPQFPQGWGELSGKHWLVAGPDGEQRISPIPPSDGKSLTVWRFIGFEATATFNCWWMEFNDSSWGFGFRKNHPPVGDWDYAGQTCNHSSLWVRDLEGGAQ